MEMTEIRDAKILSGPQLLAQRAEQTPDAVWLREVNGRQHTYAEALDESLEWARALSRLNVTEGDRVVTMVPNDSDAVFIWLGIAIAGGVDTGCNHGYLGAMLEHIVSNSGAKVLVIAEEFLERFEQIPLHQVERVVVMGGSTEIQHSLPGVEVVAWADLRGGVDPVPPRSWPNYWDMACVTYTSGTTGPSKGVLVPWGHIHTQSTAIFEDVGSSDAILSVFPPFHLSSKFCVYLSLARGAQFVSQRSFKGSSFWDDVRTHGVTSTALTATMANYLMTMPPSEQDSENSVTELLSFPLPDDFEGFAHRFGVRLRTCFTSTEISVPIVTSRDGLIVDPASCGRVREDESGTEVRLVDENDIDVPDGEVGELIVRTALPWTMNAGYLGMPEATAKAWRNGWFHTGDCFTRNERGDYYFVDRAKDALRRRGENISSFEVEGLVRQHPQVIDVGVVGVPSELGEDEVFAWLEVEDPASFDPAELIEFLTPLMPRFMVPRFVQVVQELPRTEATLRVRKFELRERGVTAAAWDREQASA